MLSWISRFTGKQKFPSYAVVFPGQGSQSPGMLADIALEFPQVHTCFDEASAILNVDLWDITQNGPVEKFKQLSHSQPILLAASYAIWTILKDNAPVKPAMLAGHSFGEYTALLCAGSLDFPDAVKLVNARTKYMEEAVPPEGGVMGVICGFDDATVAAICKQVMEPHELVAPANFNSIGQVVISGHKPAVERAIELARKKGSSRAEMLSINVPGHCEIMRPAAERLAVLLDSVNLRMPTIPVIKNVDATPYRDVASIRKGLVQQLYSPVRWVAVAQYALKKKTNILIECGPGNVLTRFNHNIDKTLHSYSTNNLSNLTSVLEFLNGASSVMEKE